MFHELVEDTFLGASGLDLTVNDSGFVDGQDSLQALESLLGAAPPKGGSYEYSPGLSLSEEKLASEKSLYTRSHKTRKPIRATGDEVDEDTDAALKRNIVSPDSDNSVFTTVPNPVRRRTPELEGVMSLEMDYEDFTHRLSLPQCTDLRNTIESFLLTILGPDGDGTPPKAPQALPSYCKFEGTKPYF